MSLEQRLQRIEQFGATMARFLGIHGAQRGGADGGGNVKEPEKFSAESDPALFEAVQRQEFAERARREFQEIKKASRGFSLTEDKYVIRRVAELKKGIR